jgi:hypothetical protein
MLVDLVLAYPLPMPAIRSPIGLFAYGLARRRVHVRSSAVCQGVRWLLDLRLVSSCCDEYPPGP